MFVLRGKTMQYGNIIPIIYPTGVFIQSVEQTKVSADSDGENVFTVTLTNHTQQRFVVKNGKTGSACEGINEIRASVDNSVGTPSVEVVETDAGAKKDINFIFKNLKGNPGNFELTEEVKQYIDQAVAAAKQYADQAVQAVKQYADNNDAKMLRQAKGYTITKTPMVYSRREVNVPSAGWYRLVRFKNGLDGRGYVCVTMRTGGGDIKPEHMTIFASVTWGGSNYNGGIVVICPCFFGNVTQLRIVSDKSGSEKYLEAYFSRNMWCGFNAEDDYFDLVVYGEDGALPVASDRLTVVPGGFLVVYAGVRSSVG